MRIIRTSRFDRRAKWAGLGDDDINVLLRALVERPEVGTVIRGSGGARKVRVRLAGRGKSGGARVVYLFGGEDIPIFVLAIFAKNEKANLTAAERNALGKMVAGILDDYRRRK